MAAAKLFGDIFEHRRLLEPPDDGVIRDGLDKLTFAGLRRQIPVHTQKTCRLSCPSRCQHGLLGFGMLLLKWCGGIATPLGIRIASDRLTRRLGRDYYQAEHECVLLSSLSTPPKQEVTIVVKKVIKEVIKKVPRTKTPSASSSSFNDFSQHDDAMKSVVAVSIATPRRIQWIDSDAVFRTAFNSARTLSKIQYLKLSKDETGMVPATGQLDKLLMMTSLSLLASSDDFDSAFASAIDDSNNTTEHPDAVDWKSIETALLVKPYPSKWPSVSAMNCPSSRSNTAEIDKSAARRSKMERLLDWRFSGSELSTALVPDSMMELKKSTSRILHDLFLEIIATATAGDNGISPCIQIEQVMEMVDEGLLALHHHADLWTVLQQKVLELDPLSSANCLFLMPISPWCNQGFPTEVPFTCDDYVSAILLRWCPVSSQFDCCIEERRAFESSFPTIIW
jgi:hypothetical protein